MWVSQPQLDGVVSISGWGSIAEIRTYGSFWKLPTDAPSLLVLVMLHLPPEGIVIAASFTCADIP